MKKKGINFLKKLKEFFIPRDFKGELKKGLQIGTSSKYAPNLDTGNPGVIWWIPYMMGKGLRKLIPETNHVGYWCIIDKKMLCKEGLCSKCEYKKNRPIKR